MDKLVQVTKFEDPELLLRTEYGIVPYIVWLKNEQLRMSRDHGIETGITPNPNNNGKIALTRIINKAPEYHLPD